MSGARAELQEIMMRTEDHLRLLIAVEEQLQIHEAELAAWMELNGKAPWFFLARYRGLTWDNKKRTDGWPDYQYHEYQTLRSGVEAERSTRDTERPLVKVMVPQFWAHAQVVARSWHVFTKGLHPHDEE